MGTAGVFALLGGLALFLYGMQMMSSGLEEAAGDRMKKILEKLTSNRFLGVLVGALITAAIQSSSATTVMTVGFVNSGMMTLSQAVWIIMGANIGTTITGQLIALDVGMLAPLFAFIGVATIVFLKAPKLHPYGKILAGLGILFIGMNMMSASMAPLRESEEFVGLMTNFSNPLLGILAGALFTAVIQSSSASVGILQALAVAGVIDFKAAVFVLFGQNIGTCITAVLASIGTNRAAKKTTVIHLLFNLIGTGIFTIACLILPLTDWVASLAPDNISQQIANMHTVFNIATTLLLLPVGQYLARIADKLLPEKQVAGQALTLTALSEEFRRGGMNFGLTAVHTDLLRQGIDRMISIASDNMHKAYDAVMNRNTKLLAEINEQEETLDILNKDIAKYISKILVHNHNRANVSDIERYFTIAGNVERIGDHAVNIAGYTRLMKEKSIKFSALACSEIEEMQNISALALSQAINVEEDRAAWFNKVEELEEKIDDMTLEYRESHLARMRMGECSEEACILYSELLNDFERIGDHIENIAEAYKKIKTVG